MSFSIRLSSDLIAAEAGSTTAVTVEILNRSIISDRYEMEVEGIDPEWKAIPVPAFPVGAEEGSTQKFFFKPPRASESAAGNYPFVVRVRSLETGESRSTQGVLEIKPFHHLGMEINPKKGVISPVRQQNGFDVTLVNLGNTEHTVRLQGNDPEDALAFEFDQETVTIAPGQQKQIEAVAVPTSSATVSRGRLIGFTITGRSLSAPNIVASAQAQLEQRSLFSPASLVVVLIAAVLFGLWLLNMPKPPSITTFQALPNDAEMGQDVTLTWNSPDASVVHLYIDGQFLSDQSKAGSITYTTPAPGKIEKDQIIFKAIAERNGRTSEPALQTVRLHPPEVVDDPKILKIRVDHDRIKLGDPFVLSYSFGRTVNKAVLSPDNTSLDPALPSISVTPKTSGSMQYSVVAYNKLGKTTTKTFTITVYDESNAKIIQFTAAPNPVQPEAGRTTITWSVLQAARTQLKMDGQPITIDESAVSGSIEVPVTKKATFTLTAYDQNGKQAIQTLVVNMVEPPKVPTPDPTPITPDGVPPTGTAGGAATVGGR